MNTNDEKRAAVQHCVSMQDRGKLLLTGINEVDSFDEQNITVLTDMLELSVRGSELHIEKLSTDTGEMSVEGKIDALIYTDDEPHQGGFFARVFR